MTQRELNRAIARATGESTVLHGTDGGIVPASACRQRWNQQQGEDGSVDRYPVRPRHADLLRFADLRRTQQLVLEFLDPGFLVWSQDPLIGLDGLPHHPRMVEMGGDLVPFCRLILYRPIPRRRNISRHP